MLIKLQQKVLYKYKEKNEKGEFEEKQREYTEIEFDFKRLTGRDLIAANTEAKALEGASFSPIISMAYHAAVAARAAKVPLDVIMEINAADFTEITVTAQDFLLNTGLQK